MILAGFFFYYFFPSSFIWCYLLKLHSLLLHLYRMVFVCAQIDNGKYIYSPQALYGGRIWLWVFLGAEPLPNVAAGMCAVPLLAVWCICGLQGQGIQSFHFLLSQILSLLYSRQKLLLSNHYGGECLPWARLCPTSHSLKHREEDSGTSTRLTGGRK